MKRALSLNRVQSLKVDLLVILELDFKVQPLKILMWILILSLEQKIVHLFISELFVSGLIDWGVDVDAPFPIEDLKLDKVI